MSNKAATDKMLAEELSSPNNVHIFEADITDFNALKVQLLTQNHFTSC